uniref:Carboxymuconolactone decarboxylase family protein n=1 Tax=Bosea sp. NBC_00436 TaxID=2969620 RepID=A0A9E7ZZC7_9HYPH
MTDITKEAVEKGIASFMATTGHVPPPYGVMIEHAPQAFAGYGLIRDYVMRSPEDGGALDLKTKELIFALLDTLAGQKEGAIAHAKLAVRNGLTLAELTEGLIQVVIVGGILTWNTIGAEVVTACAAERLSRNPAVSDDVG